MQSYFGHIFLPKDDDFQEIEGVRLFMDRDDFWIEAPINLLGVEKYNIINGAFTGLGYVSLLECNIKGTSTGIGGYEGKLSANYILCGVQFDNEDDLNFKSLSIIMPSLRTWINKRVYNKVNIFENNVSLFKHDPIDLGNFEKFILEITFSLSQSLSRESGLVINDFVTLKIKAVNTLSLWEFLEVYKKFKKFLAFIGVFDKNDDFLTFYNNDLKYKNTDTIVPIKFFTKSYNFNNTGIDAIKFPNFDIIQDDTNSILQNWYSKSDIYHSVNLILEKYFQSRLSRETYFLNSCFAIEIYHRRFRKNNKLPSAEFKKLKKSIIEKLETPQEVAFFKDKLSYANEPSFRERLLSFKEYLLFILPKNIDGDDFIKKVVLTRNYIVHRGSSENTISGLELYYASIYIEALTKWCIYKEIGFTDHQLLSMFEHTSEYIHGIFSLNKRLQSGIKKIDN